MHKQRHYGNIFDFWHIWKKVWGRVITPLWCLKAPSPATKKWIFEFYTKFGFRNHLQTFWPRWLVKSELSLGLLHKRLNLPISVHRDNVSEPWLATESPADLMWPKCEDWEIPTPTWPMHASNTRTRCGDMTRILDWMAACLRPPYRPTVQSMLRWNSLAKCRRKWGMGCKARRGATAAGAPVKSPPLDLMHPILPGMTLLSRSFRP